MENIGETLAWYGAAKQMYREACLTTLQAGACYFRDRYGATALEVTYHSYDGFATIAAVGCPAETLDEANKEFPGLLQALEEAAGFFEEDFTVTP